MKRLDERLDRLPLLARSFVFALAVAALSAVLGDRSIADVGLTIAGSFVGFAIVDAAWQFAAGARRSYGDTRDRYPFGSEPPDRRG